MTITSSLIISVAESYADVAAVKAALDAAVQKMLTSPNVITSASTGGGSSYARQITCTPAEMVELLRAALVYKETGVAQPPSAGRVFRTVVTPPL